MNNDLWLATQSGELDALDEPTRSPLLDAKVMMVDDEPLMTDMVEAHLEAAGYRNFVVTNNPLDSIALVRREDPGVLLLDLMMPGMSGFEVLEALRADKALRYTPVIVLTAANSADAKLRALQLGASDFLSKPVDASELVLRVRNTLAFHQYHRRVTHYDSATGLPGHQLFDRGIDEVLQRQPLLGGVTAVMSLTVPECRLLGESVDRATADALAKALARRLESFANALAAREALHTSIDRAPRVARLGSEHFGLIFEGLRDAEAVQTVARQVLATVTEIVTLGLREVAPTAWIGVAIAPADGLSAEALRKAADLAASHARTLGRSPLGFASPELSQRTLERVNLGSQLRGAVRRHELRLHYQPKVSLSSGRIVGVEALVRWEHPERGLVPPLEFIPLAEELGLIEGIGQWVMNRACADAAEWSRQGLGDIKVAINVAKPQFTSGRLCTMLREALFDSGLPASRLVIELTESMLMDDVAAALALMHEMKSLGLTLSIDDFGTGYSSLSYLKRFPLDELKIDRSFVIDLPGGKTDLAIVRTVIELGHSLGMSVIAEGIETQPQLDCLRQLGCDNYQGYYFSRPLAREHIEQMLRAESSAARQHDGS